MFLWNQDYVGICDIILELSFLKKLLHSLKHIFTYNMSKLLIKSRAHPIGPWGFVRMHAEKSLFHFLFFNINQQHLILIILYALWNASIYLCPICIRRSEQFIEVVFHCLFESSSPTLSSALTIN